MLPVVRLAGGMRRSEAGQTGEVRASVVFLAFLLVSLPKHIAVPGTYNTAHQKTPCLGEGGRVRSEAQQASR